MFLNSVFNFLDHLAWRTIAFFSTLTMLFILQAKGIEIGRRSRFYGLVKTKRSNAGTIKIGHACTLRSLSTSNLIGINRPCILSALSPESVLTIGNGCGFSGAVIGCFKSITIGDNVKCGANTLITDGDWHPEDSRSGEPRSVVIGNNVWLGVNVTVLKGVTIGDNSVIGAGSVVVKEIPGNVVAAGNPCKIIKYLKK